MSTVIENCDLDWVLNDLKEIQQNIKLLYDHQHSTLNHFQYEVVDKALFDSYEKISSIQKNKVLVLTQEIDKQTADLVINSPTPIFLFYWTLTDGTSFSDYFYKNLNPDIAPCGFLEQLSKLITITKARPLTIYCKTIQDLEYCDIIKKYIESC